MGDGMKKVIIAIVIFIMLCFAVKSKLIGDSFDNFDKANEAHERKVIHDFLSQ